MVSFFYQAVIFDFDGVLGQTMDDNYRAWAKAFAAFDITLGREEYLLLEGMSARAIAKAFLVRHGKDPARAGAVAKRKDELYLADNSFDFYPGVRQLLDELAAGFTLGLASGASAERLQQTVGKKFLARFAGVVTADRVARTKPDPEPYLLCARDIGLPAGRCLAIENAPLGIAAAKAAGMDCIGVCSTLARRHLARADMLVADIPALRDWFKRRSTS